MFWDWVLLINYVFRNQKYYFLKIWKFWYQYWLTISDLFNGKRKFSLRKTLVFGQNSSFLLEIESLLPNFAKLYDGILGDFFGKMIFWTEIEPFLFVITPIKNHHEPILNHDKPIRLLLEGISNWTKISDLEKNSLTSWLWRLIDPFKV